MEKQTQRKQYKQRLRLFSVNHCWRGNFLHYLCLTNEQRNAILMSRRGKWKRKNNFSSNATKMYDIWTSWFTCKHEVCDLFFYIHASKITNRYSLYAKAVQRRKWFIILFRLMLVHIWGVDYDMIKTPDIMLRAGVHYYSGNYAARRFNWLIAV